MHISVAQRFRDACTVTIERRHAWCQIQASINERPNTSMFHKFHSQCHNNVNKNGPLNYMEYFHKTFHKLDLKISSTGLLTRGTANLLLILTQ